MVSEYEYRVVLRFTDGRGAELRAWSMDNATARIAAHLADPAGRPLKEGYVERRPLVPWERVEEKSDG